MKENLSVGEEAPERKALIDVSIEGWRFAKVYGRLLAKLETGEAPRHTNQARYFLKKIDDGLDKAGLKLVTLEGQRYDPGMAVSALNIADFDPNDLLTVEQMVEPIIMGREGLIRSGTVILSKVDSK